MKYAMLTKEEISSLIEDYIVRLPLPARPQNLYDPIVYALAAGGKRLRPTLTLRCAELFGADVHDALGAAAAMEVFHNFTLLHDDIMDNATMRRGKESVCKRWGNNAAILSGDAMMIFSYRMLQSVPAESLPRVLGEFTDGALLVCEGQQLDMDFEQHDDVSIDDYLEMIRCKTSALLIASAAIGAEIAGADTDLIDSIKEFALQLGLAFQIQDDLLDSYGDESALGKRCGGDIVEGKKTYLLIAALSMAEEPLRSQLMALMHDRLLDGRIKVEMVLRIYDALDVKGVTEQAIRRHTELAVAALDSLGMDHERLVPLKEMASELLMRDK